MMNDDSLQRQESGERIVVLGGSPPTIAHLRLLQTAMAAAYATRGLFVPTPFWYVKRKLKKSGQSADALPDALRLSMLDALCQRDSRLGVLDYELHRREKGYSMETLEQLARANPGSRIYFVVGSDKLLVIPKWHRIQEFVQQFTILVAKRGGQTPEKLLAQQPFLAQHREAFVVFAADEALEGVGSSAFRQKFHQHDEPAARQMVTEEVWQMFIAYQNERKAQQTGETIADFCGPYDFLSNFYPAPVRYQGLHYGNAEAAFQAQKCQNEADKLAFCALPANKAKRLGRKVCLRQDWEAIKVCVMTEIVQAKFSQNPDLAVKLLATGQAQLVEGNTWNDCFWGVDAQTGQGQNQLGQILMAVRSQLQHKDQAHKEAD